MTNLKSGNKVVLNNKMIFKLHIYKMIKIIQVSVKTKFKKKCINKEVRKAVFFYQAKRYVGLFSPEKSYYGEMKRACRISNPEECDYFVRVVKL